MRAVNTAAYAHCLLSHTSHALLLCAAFVAALPDWTVSEPRSDAGCSHHIPHGQGNSQELKPDWFSERDIPFFRLLSIDASHDLKLVLRDFNLAACLMMDGGIVIADDFGGTSWMGVNSALYNFVFEQSRIVPFMLVRAPGYTCATTPDLRPRDKPSSRSVCLAFALVLVCVCLGVRVCMRMTCDMRILPVRPPACAPAGKNSCQEHTLSFGIGCCLVDQTCSCRQVCTELQSQTELCCCWHD